MYKGNLNKVMIYFTIQIINCELENGITSENLEEKQEAHQGFKILSEIGSEKQITLGK